jgi:hypothetical protein
LRADRVWLIISTSFSPVGRESPSICNNQDSVRNVSKNGNCIFMEHAYDISI